LAKELGSRSVTVNAVAPGFVPTALTDDLPEELKQAAIEHTPLGRFGEPEEIAAAVAFFASAEAGYITGQVLSVDGGLAMQ
jgi:3-oxoacyl-[acyl-carrier protein] reductase